MAALGQLALGAQREEVRLLDLQRLREGIAGDGDPHRAGRRRGRPGPVPQPLCVDPHEGPILAQPPAGDAGAMGVASLRIGRVELRRHRGQHPHPWREGERLQRELGRHHRERQPREHRGRAARDPSSGNR